MLGYSTVQVAKQKQQAGSCQAMRSSTRQYIMYHTQAPRQYNSHSQRGWLGKAYVLDLRRRPVSTKSHQFQGVGVKVEGSTSPQRCGRHGMCSEAGHQDSDGCRCRALMVGANMSCAHCFGSISGRMSIDRSAMTCVASAITYKGASTGAGGCNKQAQVGRIGLSVAIICQSDMVFFPHGLSMVWEVSPLEMTEACQ
jgi:hypothetical protein